MKKADHCISCGKGLLERGSATLHCPQCDEILGRCSSCREQSVRYVCSKCQFVGP